MLLSSIPLNQRCDGIMHCGDQSDEIECERIITGRAYLDNLPPPAIASDKPEVQLSVKISKILDINEVQSKVKFQVKLSGSFGNFTVIFF